ncbi:MAG: hypothetical protein GOV15_00790, partial [Candidatus Diapherotrites archaeon]|nr:hypothetical protein [Candidatus Diapherotrites archaeon]
MGKARTNLKEEDWHELSPTEKAKLFKKFVKKQYPSAGINFVDLAEKMMITPKTTMDLGALYPKEKEIEEPVELEEMDFFGLIKHMSEALGMVPEGMSEMEPEPHFASNPV